MPRACFSSSTEKPLVTITGVSGFLGSQTCLAFLQDGNYRVRGTVRSTSNAIKIDPLKAGFGEYFDQLELVEADLLDERSMIDACAGSTYVVHTAGKFAYGLPEKSLVEPAVKGTNAIMKACAEHKVKRVVITSSIAAIKATDPDNKPPADKGWTEEYWSNPDRKEPMDGVTKSKTLGELAAWDFQAAQAEYNKFEITTINPALMMGPSICSGDGFSEMWMKGMLNGQKKKVPRSRFGFVDVRDVALAHLKAIQIEEAGNKRFLLASCNMWLRDVSAILAPKYNPQGFKVPTVEQGKKDIDPGNHYDNTRSKEELGITYTPIATTLCDMADSMIASGKVQAPTS